MKKKLKVLVAGVGHMGSAHARAYANLEGFEIAGLVARSPEKRERLAVELGGVPQFERFEAALTETQPDAVCIATYTDTHADYCLKSLEAGCHVFVEKPLAETVEAAHAVVKKALEMDRKLVVGYILRVHPGWQQFIALARTLGKPLVMRMNLNQQSSGAGWQTHKNLMESVSPIVDCGVHYVDVMCQMTGARPVRVHAIGARLVGELKPGMYNYGQLQVIFADGSVGWYESGWGPMISETAFFIKDVIGPLGSISMVAGHEAGSSADVSQHTRMDYLRLHPAVLDDRGQFLQPDKAEAIVDEPSHQELCDREQVFFRRAIEEDLDLSNHLQAAVDSLRIVLAADQSTRSGEVIVLE